MLDKPQEEQAQINQIIKAECRSCNRITNHLILACFEQLEHEYVDGAIENELCRYQIAQCKGCDLLALLLEVWVPHGEIIQPYEGSDIVSYPPSASKPSEATDNLRKPLPPNEVKMLPDNLRRIYRETLAAFTHLYPC